MYSTTASLPAAASSALAARHIAREVLAVWGVSDPTVQLDVELVLSEMVSNAVRHASGGRPLEMGLELTADRVQVWVRDADPRPPVRRVASPADESGRGLEVVEALAEEWGVEPDGDGKCVWAALALPVAATPLPVEPMPEQAGAPTLEATPATDPVA